MTLREEIAALMDKGVSQGEIVQLIRRDHPNTRPHRIRELYGTLMGPEYSAQVKAEKEAKKLQPVAKPEKPKRYVVEDPETGQKKIFKEVLVGLQGFDQTANNGGGVRKILISLPYVAWIDREEV